MHRRAQLHAFTLLVTASLLLVPGSASATTTYVSGGGGLGIGVSSAPTAPPASSGTGVGSGDVTVKASGNGITLATRAATLLRSRLRFTGRVAPGRGRIVAIERSGRQTGGRWVVTTQATVRPGGGYTAIWPANHIGRFAIRAVVERAHGAASRATPSSPALTITVYRPSIATIYGPGFWGQRTACGQILRRDTLGVANRTLPCGTPVALLWHGRTIVVPVIDRGPYANHADWDLTSATAAALGMDGTETLGAVSLPR